MTSSQTISCAEQFAYDLQALHRATIIGDFDAFDVLAAQRKRLLTDPGAALQRAFTP